MANVTDFANNAAAVAAGYKSTPEDRGAAANPRFRRYYDKPVSGAAGTDGGAIQIRAIGESNVDQATADAQALSSLNAQRRHYYGGSPGRASGSPQSNSGRGGVHTIDST